MPCECKGGDQGRPAYGQVVEIEEWPNGRRSTPIGPVETISAAKNRLHVTRAKMRGSGPLDKYYVIEPREEPA